LTKRRGGRVVTVTREDRVAEDERLAAIRGGTLRCVECDAVSVGHSPGWRAYIAKDARDDEPAEVAVLCAECAEWEFGST
jgi:hypothetical protein